MNIEELRNLIASCDEKLTGLRAKAAEKDISAEDLAKTNKEIMETASLRSNYEGQIQALTEMATRSAEKKPLVKVAKSDMEKRSTEEYHAAFYDYLKRGVVNSDILVRGAATEGVSTDLGVLVPTVVVQEIIKKLGNHYGKLYQRVRHLNIPAGVKIPKGEFEVAIKWAGESGSDVEHGVSNNQKGGAVNDYVQFGYNIAEARVAESLLLSILKSPIFDDELSTAITKAVLKDWDNMILSGTGANQPEGILVNAKVPKENKIAFTAAEATKWDSWLSKVFAVTPEEFDEADPIFTMTKGTFNANILTLQDGNKHPLAIQTPLTDGGYTKSFFGRTVDTANAAGLVDFATAKAGELFGLYWCPELAYAINGVADFGVRRYFDENTNQWVTKVLYIADGKVLNETAIYELVKAA